MREIKKDNADFGIWKERLLNVQDRLLTLKQMVCKFYFIDYFGNSY